MAGRGQHTIPRHFLKPFISSNGSDNLWLHRREVGKPILVTRGNAAKQRDFYAKPSNDDLPSLDDLITEYEHKISSFVDQLRSLSDSDSPDPIVVGEVAAHLSIRSSHTRAMTLKIIQIAAEAIVKLPRDLSSLFGNNRMPAHRPTEKLADKLTEIIQDRGLDQITGIRTESLLRVMYFDFREKGLDRLSETQEIFRQFGEKLSCKNTASAAHIRALSETITPKNLIDKLAGLQWSIVGYPTSDAILPDCVCICHTSDGGWEPLLFQFGLSEPDIVVLPLSPDKLIIGISQNTGKIDLCDYNKIAASACLEFFLSNKRHNDLLDHQSDLGENTRRKISGVIDTSFREVRENFIGHSIPSSEEKTNKLQPERLEVEKTSNELSFQLTLRDFGDKEYAQALAKILNQLIKDILPLEAFARLDGFTFANEYEAALREVVRGFDTKKEVKTMSGEEGTGIAMPLTVMRGGEIKTRIVMRSYLAEYLMSEQYQDCRIATSTITRMLASVYFQDLMARRFPEKMLHVIEDPVESFLYGYAGNVFDTYLMMRFSQATQEEFEIHQKALTKQLTKIPNEIILRRKQYRKSGNFDAFVDFTFHTLEHLLNSVACVLGIQRALEGTPALTNELTSTLLEMKMDAWLHLFDQDLDAFFCGLGNWIQFEELFFVNRHLEHWLLQVAILVDYSETGEVYIHIL